MFNHLKRETINQPTAIDIDGLSTALIVKPNPRAKKLILRYDARKGYPQVTAPPGTSEKQIRSFVEAHLDWIEAQIHQSTIKLIQDGSIINFLGIPHHVHFTDERPRQVIIEDGNIHVGGPHEQAGARLERWLRLEAKAKLSEACLSYAQLINRDYNRISLGDMKSRWGSCSSKGTLRFNWRLVMAPKPVLDYVAAHEVCHLREMNHSPRFWRWVETCMPDYKTHRLYLREQGQTLMDIRFS